ncbi:MAG: hypothetical protein QM570_21495, partial [Planctomycetota bacterium]|nr:hypothetical protein [Planctomycetota bacterium]
HAEKTICGSGRTENERIALDSNFLEQTEYLQLDIELFIGATHPKNRTRVPASDIAQQMHVMFHPASLTQEHPGHDLVIPSAVEESGCESAACLSMARPLGVARGDKNSQ